MKFSIVVSVPDRWKLSDFEKNVKIISELGYDGVELNIRNPRQIDQNKVVDILSTRQLTASSMITGKALAMDGLSLTSPNMKIRSLAIKRIKDHISFASVFSATVLIGWIRGNWKNNEEKARKLFVDVLRECGKFAEDKNVLLGIEPINRYEIDSIHTVNDVIRILEEIDLSNIGIVADTFHMNIEENESIHKSIRRCRNHLFHVHVADNNRKIPGRGYLPFKKFFKALKKMRYNRFISIEVVPPLPDFETIAEESIKYLHRFM